MNGPQPLLTKTTKTASLLTAAAAIIALASCAHIPLAGQTTPRPEPEPQPVAQTPEPELTPQEKPAPDKIYEWSGDGREVTHIWVDVDEQKARFYDGQEQIGWSTIASGLKAHPTPTGEFEVMEKVSKKRSNLYGKIYNSKGGLSKSNAKMGRDPIPPGGRFEGAKMPFFMRLTYDGIGLHAGPIPRPGSPASHGCIRMPKTLAPVLYRHVSIGTPVKITGSGPSYGRYAEKQRAARIARAEAEAAAAAAAAEEAQAQEGLAASGDRAMTPPAPPQAADPTSLQDELRGMSLSTPPVLQPAVSLADPPPEDRAQVPADGASMQAAVDSTVAGLAPQAAAAVSPEPSAAQDGVEASAPDQEPASATGAQPGSP